MVNPTTHIVLMGILPWGLINQNGVYVWPNQFTQAISLVNSLSEAFAAGDPFVHYIDCGHQLFPTAQVGVLSVLCSVSDQHCSMLCYSTKFCWQTDLCMH